VKRFFLHSVPFLVIAVCMGAIAALASSVSTNHDWSKNTYSGERGIILTLIADPTIAPNTCIVPGLVEVTNANGACNTLQIPVPPGFTYNLKWWRVTATGFLDGQATENCTLSLFAGDTVGDNVGVVLSSIDLGSGTLSSAGDSNFKNVNMEVSSGWWNIQVTTGPGTGSCTNILTAFIEIGYEIVPHAQ
jgi:hypothetical protein